MKEEVTISHKTGQDPKGPTRPRCTCLTKALICNLLLGLVILLLITILIFQALTLMSIPDHTNDHKKRLLQQTTNSSSCQACYNSPACSGCNTPPVCTPCATCQTCPTCYACKTCPKVCPKYISGGIVPNNCLKIFPAYNTPNISLQTLQPGFTGQPASTVLTTFPVNGNFCWLLFQLNMTAP